MDNRQNGEHPRAYQFKTIDGLACVVIEDTDTVLFHKCFTDIGFREIAERA